MNMKKLEVSLCTVPMLGHLMPLLPYAAELLRRGHAVTIFHEGDPKYRRLIEQCGLEACESVVYNSPSQLQSDGLYESLQSHYHNKNKPDVVVYDFFAVDAADAADYMGVPAVGVFPNPRSINPWAATNEQQASLLWSLWCRTVCTGMEAVLARLLWCQRARTRWSRSLPILREQDLYPSPYMPRHIIGCTSAALEFPNLPRAPLFHMVGPALPGRANPIPADLQAWLDAQGDKPIIYVAFGTMFRHTVASVRKLEAELASLDVAVLWSLPAQHHAALQQHPRPSHWRVEPFVPQVSLLRSGRLAAFVTHCGSNSVYEALLCGIPMVCCPGMADQPANAVRPVRAGVGVIAKKGQVGRALRQLLEQQTEMSRSAQALAVELESQQGAQGAANVIEKIAHEGAVGPLTTARRWPWWPLPILATLLCILL
jgi:UDP:flavonoid glycosyltransferase YjiC (YdhE family)